MQKVTATYAMANWDETPMRDVPPPGKCTIVKAHGDITGALEGKGETFYLISYNDGVGGPFCGYMHFTGKIGDREGSFKVAENGVADAKAARSEWTIIAGSGTGALEGISGTGSFIASEGLTFDFELEYELA